MADLKPEQIRNFVLVGHTGSGKTSLGEALLFKTGVTNRLGSVPGKTSFLDSSDEAKERGSSLESAVACFSHAGLHINMIDTPGVRAYCGPAIASLAAVECAVVVISAAAGIQVNTRTMFDLARRQGLAIWIVVTHIDAPNTDLSDVVSAIQETFGTACTPLNLPTGGGKGVIDCLKSESGTTDFSDVGEAHTAVIEAVVGADDALMEKYLGGELSSQEALSAAPRAVAAGAFVPILFCNSLSDVGIPEVLDALVAFCPSPATGLKRKLVKGESAVEIKPDPSGPFIGQVFRITTDPKSNIKYLNVRSHSGTLTSDMTVRSVKMPKGTRPGHVLRINGPNHAEIASGKAGDIITLAKLDFAIGDTITSGDPGEIAMPALPNPMFALALVSKSRGDEDKISSALRRLSEEDPCFISEHRAGGELVVRGMGEVQLRTYLTRLAKHNKLEVETRPPRIPYRETITVPVMNVEYTHKKQSGGSGEYGKVVINLLPAPRGEGYEFVDKIFGGSIDQQFRPSVDKGVRSSLDHGGLAGYPVVDFKLELIDGKTHPVDSKDGAFQKAGRGAFKEAFSKAKPVLLEPIVNIEVTVPAENVGDIQGDLASRRGRPQGQDMIPGNMSVIRAVVPLSELSDYSSRLSSITAGQGSYSMDFSHYETVPGNVQQQIVEAHKKEMEEAAS